MQLRPYQQHIVDEVERGWAEFHRQLVVCPTGGGKTIVFAHLARRQLPGRTLILAHREELISQAIVKLHLAADILADKEQAEARASLSAPVVVASVQTLLRRLDRWPQQHFALIVADEAHHALSESWQAVLSHFSAARVLGVTATPDRGDKRNLGAYFESIASETGLFDLVGQGYLCPIVLQSVPLRIDVSAVHSVAGDLDQVELGHVLEPYLGAIASAIREHAGFRRVLAFLPLVKTSQQFAASCRAAGLLAEHVDGESIDRAAKLARFGAGEYDVLSNAMLLTEGYDEPGIDCVVVLRPTRSRPLFAQMVGRGTRIAPHKRDLLLLDFLWQHERHELVHPAHLVAQTQAEAEQITRMIQERSTAMPADIVAQLPLDLRDLASAAQAEREEKLRAELEAHRHKSGKLISAEEYCLRSRQPDLAGWEPTMRWESQPITDKQARVLASACIDLDSVRGKGHASKLIDIIFRARANGLASEKVRGLMRRLPAIAAKAGVIDVAAATVAEAGRFFALLRAKSSSS
jgi:superfamily II DNA or RNA helicase